MVSIDYKILLGYTGGASPLSYDGLITLCLNNACSQIHKTWLLARFPR